MWVTCKDCAAARKGLELLQALMSTGVLEEGPAHSKVGRAIASLTSVRVACSNPAFQAVPCVYNPYGLHAKGHRYTHRRKHMHTYVLSLSLSHIQKRGWGGEVLLQGPRQYVRGWGSQEVSIDSSGEGTWSEQGQ